MAFESSAHLVPGYTGGIFVHDRQTGVTEIVSIDSFGNQANRGSSRSSISGNGRYVTFASTASNLVPGDTNEAWDIFVHNRRLTPMFEITSFGPEHIWPPNRRMAEITVSGKVFLPEGFTLLGAGYSIEDEYGVYTSGGELIVNADGSFTLSLQVEAWRDGSDRDGRHYSITLFAEDEAGVESKTLKALVPHDRRK